MSDWPWGDLRQWGYDVLVVDPPWAFKNFGPAGERKNANQHYACLPVKEIEELPVIQLARPDTLLLLWTTAPTLQRAFGVVERWGFKYKSWLCWDKVFPSGKNAVGTGYRVRTMSELVIVATLGNPQQLKAFPSHFPGVRREHSRKPEEFYRLVEGAMPNAYRADVFARERRAGWDGFGDQLELFKEENAA